MSRERRVPGAPLRSVAIVPLLLALAPWASGSPVPAQQGVLFVEFKVEAPYMTGIAESARRDLEQRAADIAAELGRKRYPFLDWKRGDGEAPALRIRLLEATDVSRIEDCPPKMVLDFAGVPPAGAASRIDILDRPVTLYESCSAVFPNDTGTVRARIQGVLDTAFSAPEFKSRLEGRLLNLVSLTNRLEPEPDERFIVPLPCDPTFLGDSSQLAVNYQARDPDEEGQLGLEKPTTARASGAFRLTAVGAPGAREAVRIAEAITEGRLIQMNVYMNRYEYSTNCLRRASAPTP